MSHVQYLIQLLIPHFDLRSENQFHYFYTKKEEPMGKQFSQLKKTLNDFFLGRNTRASVMENGTLECQSDGRYINPERIVKMRNRSWSKSGHRKAVDNAVKTRKLHA